MAGQDHRVPPLFPPNGAAGQAVAAAAAAVAAAAAGQDVQARPKPLWQPWSDSDGNNTTLPSHSPSTFFLSFFLSFFHVSFSHPLFLSIFLLSYYLYKQAIRLAFHLFTSSFRNGGEGRGPESHQ